MGRRARNGVEKAIQTMEKGRAWLNQTTKDGTLSGPLLIAAKKPCFFNPVKFENPVFQSSQLWKPCFSIQSTLDTLSFKPVKFGHRIFKPVKFRHPVFKSWLKACITPWNCKVQATSTRGTLLAWHE